MSVDVSVVIVNWNTKDLLLKCIESITGNRSRYRTEIIVVDNGPSDSPMESVRQ